MTVVRLSDGKLFLHSPIAPSDALLRELDRRGEVRFLASPNKLHTLYLDAFARAYPAAKLYVPRQEEWADELTQVLLQGNRIMEEVVFFHRLSRTLILGDLCFNFDRTFPWETRIFARIVGTYERLSPSRDLKLATRDRPKARAGIDRVLSWDFDRVIVSHGRVIERGGKEAFRQAFAWLDGAR